MARLRTTNLDDVADSPTVRNNRTKSKRRKRITSAVTGGKSVVAKSSPPDNISDDRGEYAYAISWKTSGIL